VNTKAKEEELKIISKPYLDKFYRVYEANYYIGLKQFEDLNDLLISKKCIRGLPPAENFICRAIVKTIRTRPDLFPPNSFTSIIGTPTPLTVSPNYPKNDSIQNDNLRVAEEAYDNSKVLNIVIGDIKDRQKSIFKAQAFNSHGSINKARLWVGPVTAETFRKWILKQRDKNSRKPISIIYMGNGTWKGSSWRNRIRPFETNFAEVAIDITSRYKNIYILAMASKSFGFGFELLWLNNKHIKKIEIDNKGKIYTLKIK